MPFDGLTIPKEQEEAVMALAETHAHPVPGFDFDDIIVGKGRGLIVLLQYDSYDPSHLHLLMCNPVAPLDSGRL